MSVLSFPRIYFKGFISWDPSTLNNNDALPTYAAAQAALNWEFLANAPGLTAIGATTISPENFRETFRPWASSMNDAIGMPPCEWNMFGTHAVNFVQYQPPGATAYVSQVTGGATAPTGPYSMITHDPFVGATVGMTGAAGPTAINAPAVMVDNNPVASWSTQIYWGELSFGNGDLALRLPMNYRMFLRWVDFARTYPQGPPSGCFQTAVPYEQVTWPTNGASPLVDALQAAAKKAKGIMVRFTAYNLQQFVNGQFNDIAIAPTGMTSMVQDLSTAWQQWNENQSTTGFFSNPAITNVVGTIGVWNEGELASMPGGRYFVAQNPIAPAPTGSTGLPKSAGDDVAVPTGIRIPPEMLVAAAAAPGPPTIPLGPAVAEINGNLVSLDFSSTIPEVAGSLAKTNFGPLSLGVLTSGGSIQELAVIDYSHYGQTAYQTTSGIIDVPLWGSGPFEGPLVISVGDNIALQETIFDAQTDSRGIYLDQGGATAIDINVYQRGVLSPGAKVLVARYGLGVQSATANQTLPLVAAGPTAATPTYTSNVQVVNFTTGAQSTLTVTGPTSTVSTNVTVISAGAGASGATGIAQLGLTAQAPGFVALAFFPYGPTGATPTPPLNLTSAITYADYTTVRVLPFDENVPRQFVKFWNGLTGPTAEKREKAWDFIYNPTLPTPQIPSGGGILYLYDQLFNVMLEHVDLGSLTAVEAAKVPIWNRIAPNSAAEGSSNMPITRDMSAGKRTTLQLWIYLAANNYNVPTLSLTAIDGWTPPSPKPKG